MVSGLPHNLGVAVLAVCSLVFAVVHGDHLLQGSDPAFVLLTWTVGPLVVSLVLLCFSYWLWRQQWRLEYQIMMALWFLVGATTVVVFGILIVVNQESLGPGVQDPLYMLVNSATGGAAIGSIVGLYDIRSRRRDDRLVELHDAVQQLLDTETKAETSQIAVETMTTLLDLNVSAIWLLNDDTLEPVAYTEESKHVFDEIPEFEKGNSLAWQVYEAQSTRLVTDVADQPDRYNPDTDVVMELIIPLGHHGVLICGSFERAGIEPYQRELTHILASHTKLVLDRISRTEDLQSREAELERQNERLEEFASVVSHDLRNPLSVIRGYLELAREDPTDTYFDHIEAAADRMDTLIDDLLSLSKSGARVQELESVDLETVATEAWSQIQSDSVTLRIVPPLGSVQADESRLKQVFENLFRNSVEHGDTVSEITVTGLSDGFAVTDDGTGIPASDRGDVFDFGYSNAEDGSGLGLSIVHEIVEGHGWSVSITEGDAGGARFEFRCEPTKSGG